MTEGQRGRPRNEATRHAILEATRDVLFEVGYQRMTIESIAARAGAGKQTVYRWWASKSALVADSVLGGHLVIVTATLPTTDSLDDDLATWFSEVSVGLQDDRVVSIVRSLAAAAAEDDTEEALLWKQVTEPVRIAIVERLERARGAGQLADATDSDAIADIIIGSLLLMTLSRADVRSRLAAIASVIRRLTGNPLDEGSTL